MKHLNVMKKYGARIGGALATGGAVLVAGPANAQATGYVASAQTGINQAKDDALTVGGYVIAAVAILIAIGWILSMVKKR